MIKQLREKYLGKYPILYLDTIKFVDIGSVYKASGVTDPYLVPKRWINSAFGQKVMEAFTNSEGTWGIRTFYTGSTKGSWVHTGIINAFVKTGLRQDMYADWLEVEFIRDGLILSPEVTKPVPRIIGREEPKLLGFFDNGAVWYMQSTGYVFAKSLYNASYRKPIGSEPWNWLQSNKYAQDLYKTIEGNLFILGKREPLMYTVNPFPNKEYKGKPFHKDLARGGTCWSPYLMSIYSEVLGKTCIEWLCSKFNAIGIEHQLSELMAKVESFKKNKVAKTNKQEERKMVDVVLGETKTTEVQVDESNTLGYINGLRIRYMDGLISLPDLRTSTKDKSSMYSSNWLNIPSVRNEIKKRKDEVRETGSTEWDLMFYSKGAYRGAWGGHGIALMFAQCLGETITEQLNTLISSYKKVEPEMKTAAATPMEPTEEAPVETPAEVIKEKITGMTKAVEPYIDYNGFTIKLLNDDQMVSLTDMWIANGRVLHKRPVKWLENDSTKELIETLKEKYRGPISDLGFVRVQRGGKDGGGTWAHWQLALAYAKFLSAEFHLHCNELLKERWIEDLYPEIGFTRNQAKLKDKLLKQGHSTEFAEARIDSIYIRNKLVSVIGEAGLASVDLYVKMTMATNLATLGMGAKEFKAHMGLPPSAQTRNHMEPVHLHGIKLIEAMLAKVIEGKRVTDGTLSKQEVVDLCKGTIDSYNTMMTPFHLQSQLPGTDIPEGATVH